MKITMKKLEEAYKSWHDKEHNLDMLHYIAGYLGIKDEEEELGSDMVTIPNVDGCFEDQNVLYDHHNMPYNREFKIFDLPGTYTHAQALEKAESLGLRLMTKEEIYLLIAAGVLKEGDKSFWSASVVSDNHDNAWCFDGYDGNVSNDTRNDINAVRCVARKCEDN